MDAELVSDPISIATWMFLVLRFSVIPWPCSDMVLGLASGFHELHLYSDLDFPQTLVAASCHQCSSHHLPLWPLWLPQASSDMPSMLSPQGPSTCCGRWDIRVALFLAAFKSLLRHHLLSVVFLTPCLKCVTCFIFLQSIWQLFDVTYLFVYCLTSCACL